MPQLAAQQPPPADYYADNVRYLLTHVGEHHVDLLSAAEIQFIDAVTRASIQAQRLFARVLSRKGPWIRIDKLRYLEVEDVTESLAELSQLGIVEINAAAPADALLGLLTQSERADVFPAIAVKGKTRWIEDCVSRYPDAAIRTRLADSYPWVNLNQYECLRICQLLFFGDDQQDMSAFVMKDLGLTRYEDYSLRPAERLLKNREQLLNYLRFRRLSHLSHRVEEAADLAVWLSSSLWSNAANRLEQRQKDRTLNRLGRWHERRAEFDHALDCYGRSLAHPGRERRVRLLSRLGDDEGATALLGQIRAAPRGAEEEDFAERFQVHGKKRVARVQIPTTEIRLIAPVEEAIEAHAAMRLSSNGTAAWHLENRFPLGIAGLAFWDEVFAGIPGAFVNPFQSAPVDLFWPDFMQAREALLAAKLERLADPAVFARTLRDTYAAKQGVANRLVSWRHFSDEVLEAVLAHIPHDTLLMLADYVIRNLWRARTGFPDLLVIYGEGQFEFVEVKGPTDQLQPGQRVWFKFFREFDLPARVLKFHLKPA